MTVFLRSALTKLEADVGQHSLKYISLYMYVSSFNWLVYCIKK